jgi:hypothetical protein
MTRNKLPNRRSSEIINVTYEGNQMIVGFSTGEILEVFINTKKQSTAVESILRDAACIISIALQYGAPFEVLRAAVTRNADGIAPASPIGAAMDAIIGERERK